MPPKSKTPGAQKIIIVRIEDVDLTNRLVHAFDKTNGRIQVSFRDIIGGGLLRIPVQNERWIAERVGYVWRLKSRLTSLDEHARILAAVEAGDAIIAAPGVLYIDVAEVRLNNKVLGHTRREMFTGTSLTTVTLTGTPSNYDSIQPFFNGLLLDPTEWTASGSVISFTAPHTGTIVIYYESAEAHFEDDGSITSTAVISDTDSYTA